MQKLDLYFYGEIGWWQTSAEHVSEMLRYYSEASEIVLHINSIGGYVTDGYGIYNLMKTSGKPVTAIIEGDCASIASVIALSASKVYAAPLSRFLVHDAMGGVQGTAEDMVKYAEELTSICTQMVGVYVAKTGKSEDEIRALMKEDRWMTAEEAKEWGFIDEILTEETFATKFPTALKAVAKAGKPNFTIPTNMSQQNAPVAPAPAAAPAPTATNEDRGILAAMASLVNRVFSPKAEATEPVTEPVPATEPVTEEKKEDVEPAPAASAQEEQKPDPNAELLARIEALEAAKATTEAENTTLKADIEELNSFVPAAKRKGTAAQAVVKEENTPDANGVIVAKWAPKEGTIAAQAAKMYSK